MTVERKKGNQKLLVLPPCEYFLAYRFSALCPSSKSQTVLIVVKDVMLDIYARMVLMAQCDPERAVLFSGSLFFLPAVCIVQLSEDRPSSLITCLCSALLGYAQRMAKRRVSVRKQDL